LTKESRGLTERQIRRRENILAAARKLISEKGYEGVTMRDLARESGVAPKTLYHQFENKEKLLRTAVEERFRYLYQVIDDAQIAKGVDRLFHILDSVAKTTAENVAYARALAPLLGSAENSTFTLIRKRTYRRAIEQIAAEGDFLDWVDVEVLATLVFRQVNPIYLSSWMARTSGRVATHVVKLDICLILAAVTRGYTHDKVIHTARQLQQELRGREI
jgi:AcrR family transcriptional regulator